MPLLKQDRHSGCALVGFRLARSFSVFDAGSYLRLNRDLSSRLHFYLRAFKYESTSVISEFSSFRTASCKFKTSSLISQPLCYLVHSMLVAFVFSFLYIRIETFKYINAVAWEQGGLLFLLWMRAWYSEKGNYQLTAVALPPAGCFPCNLSPLCSFLTKPQFCSKIFAFPCALGKGGLGPSLWPSRSFHSCQPISL